MVDREKVVKALTECIFLHEHPDDDAGCFECPYRPDEKGTCPTMIPFLKDVLELMKEQEPRELTKEEWEKWKKDERRDPICMIWYRDTTPFWVLRPEEINELLYLMGKIKLFTKKPTKEKVKWDEAD